MRRYIEHKGADSSDVIRELDLLADKNTDKIEYRDAFHRLGILLGNTLKADNNELSTANTLIACANEDADWLAKGVMEGIGLPDLPMAVFWTKRFKLEDGNDISPIISTYQDKTQEYLNNVIIVKSIISSSCVVKTQLLRLLSTLSPNHIYILAPVMLDQAEENLKNEFPDEIFNKFRFITFAIDDKIDNGEIIPGIGGMVYPRLGLGDGETKNKYIPEIVKERMMAI